MNSSLRKWFPFSTYDPDNDPSEEKIICFHHAGGSASVYRSWTLDKNRYNILCTELPGKGTRTGEEYITDINELLEPLCRAVIDAAGDGKYSFFGHSMGAGIAFYACSYLTHKYGKPPSRLIVAGRQPPDVENPGEFKSSMDDEALINEIRRYGATPEEVLENKELMDIIIPRIRKDYELNDTLVYSGEILEVPVIAHSALEDDGAQPEIMKHWADYTTASFRLRSFKGNHFWITDDKQYYQNIFREMEG